ncbi:MAG: 50S ribosomal protein L9 [Candidatus Hydrogenedentes bacterium]|nr:50S ribosomal protein L9 [Candidatus Hydrogenedentota bacterium]
MNVILCENVEHLGVMGEQVRVADGYARNYLIPRKLAVEADSATAKQIEHELRIIKRREEKQRAAFTGVADKMKSLTLEFKMRAGDDDKIFGSVTPAMIVEKLAELGYEIHRKQIVLDEPIKSLGIFAVTVKLFPGIETPVKVWVTGLQDEISTVVEETPEEADTTSETD